MLSYSKTFENCKRFIFFKKILANFKIFFKRYFINYFAAFFSVLAAAFCELIVNFVNSRVNDFSQRFVYYAHFKVFRFVHYFVFVIFGKGVFSSFYKYSDKNLLLIHNTSFTFYPIFLNI